MRWLNVLDTVDSCSDPGLAVILSIFKTAMTVMQIIVPILLIIMASVGFTQLMANPDDKKAVKKLINKFVAAIIVMLIPTIVNWTMELLHEYETFDIATCWTAAESRKEAIESDQKNYNYQTIGDQTKKSITITRQDVTINDSDSNSNSSNSSNNSSSATSRTPTNYIFIGDSRTVGMKSSVSGSSNVWSAKTAEGYNWLKNTGAPAISGNIKEGSAIIIWLGVNDLHNADKYVSYINNKGKSWKNKGATTYFVSVGPIDAHSSITNDDIKSFNNTLKNGLTKATYIDIYSDMVSQGYSTTDGVHYTTETYRKVYNLIKSKI